MQIVIEIPENEYNYILKSDNSAFADYVSKESMMYAIKNGTPLPKGHGDLQVKEAIKVLNDVQSQFQASLDEVDVDKDCKEAEEDNRGVVNALEMAIKTLKEEPVLDKIRTEIEEQKECRCFDDDDMYIYITGLNDAIDIIDKYLAEMEKKKGKEKGQYDRERQ